MLDVFQEDVECYKCDDAQKGLSDVVERDVEFGHLSVRFRVLERSQCECDFFVDALSFGHNELVLLHHPCRKAGLRQSAVKLELRAVGVVDQRRRQNRVYQQGSHFVSVGRIGNGLCNHFFDILWRHQFALVDFPTDIAFKYHYGV